MQYTWDPNKAAANLRKHRVSFEEAVTVFDDTNLLAEVDTARGEYRLNVIGWSSHGRMLFVVSCEIQDDQVRIISARKATRAEARKYDEG